MKSKIEIFRNWFELNDSDSREVEGKITNSFWSNSSPMRRVLSGEKGGIHETFCEDGKRGSNTFPFLGSTVSEVSRLR